MLLNLLVYRLIIVNLIGAVALALAWQRGWITAVIDGDSTGIVYVMAGLFTLFMVSLFIRAGKVSKYLNILKRDGTPRHVNKTKFLEKMAHLEDISEWLVTMGLLGTVIGISIALFGVDSGSLGSAEGVKKVVAGLISGMQVALYTTIAGSILGLWASINCRILRTAAVVMLEDIRGRHE